MACPLCQHESYQNAYLPPTRYRGKLFRYLKCLDCHSLYLGAMPTTEDIHEMYKPASYHDQFYASDHFGEKPQNQALSLLEIYRSSGNLLDIGCGTGGFMQCATEQGYNVFGCELNEKLIEALKAKHLNVFHQMDLFSSQYSHFFDVIHMGHILEHLPKPMAYLRQVLTCLKPEGHIIIQGPLENQATLQGTAFKLYKKIHKMLNHSLVDSYVPYHVTHMTQKGILKLLQNCNIKVCRKNLYEGLWPLVTGKPQTVRAWTKYAIAKLSQNISHSKFGKKMYLGNRILLIGQKSA